MLKKHISIILAISLTTGVLGLIPKRTAFAAAPYGCYQQLTSGPNGGQYEKLTNDQCNGKPTYPDSGKADPTQNCYVYTTALDGSTVWSTTTGCDAIVLAGATTPSGDNSIAGNPISNNEYQGHYHCGAGKGVATTINVGCRGIGNPIVDMALALLRFILLGVGIIFIGSVIVGGIQYSASADNPQAKANAIKRLGAVGAAFLMFLLAYALLNFIVPGGLIK